MIIKMISKYNSNVDVESYWAGGKMWWS